MFGWLKKQKSVAREPDAVWRDQAGKLEGLYQGTLARTRQGEAVLLIAHFAETAEQVAQFFATRGLPCQRVSAAELLRPHMNASPTLLLSDALPSEAQLRALSQLPHPRLALAVERYPIPTREEEVERFLSAFPPLTRLTLHASLDEELLRRFMDAGTIALLDKLGWPPDSPLTSPTIGAAIRSAQQRIQKLASGDGPAPSAAHWFRYHFRGE